ncbi:peptidyl-prolyl cis-trans isomerase C [Thalassococcus halodurans]|uniref:Parvulin-like PPIase n=1 Tax=Thalassococcus halodurans TaxID=373675 RepID=A0A1H5YH90_9RHOB|nr:peptidylprolyl isomerase [Thalassococcus halodurans]SEG23499.1 peptidyl-prolyl cis-trans isomerase C [Thalassococcus halodurans]
MLHFTDSLSRMCRVSGLAMMLALPVAAHAQDEVTADTVVATVNGVEIKLGHMLMVRAGLPEQYQQMPDTVLWDGILDQLIQQEVLAQQPEAVETNRVKLALENERRALVASERLAVVSQDVVTDEAIEAKYAELFGSVEPKLEYNANHILVETEEEAAALVAELEGGADFEALAKEKSTGPSGPSGGALGWFGEGQMVAPFEQAVMELEVGAVSAPVLTQFGWHVIKLNETREKGAPALEEVREQIAGQIEQEGVQAMIKEYVDAADVTKTDTNDVDTSVLSNLELLEE